MLAKTKNFHPKTDLMLGCSCGCGRNEVKQEALGKLQELRNALGKSMEITSAYRCEKHPAEARKVKPGRHNQGIAFDIRVTDSLHRRELVQLGLDHSVGGIGVAKTFVHFDFRGGEPVMWTY